jgi:hypothetical protein
VPTFLIARSPLSLGPLLLADSKKGAYVGPIRLSLGRRPRL